MTESAEQGNQSVDDGHQNGVPARGPQRRRVPPADSAPAEAGPTTGRAAGSARSTGDGTAAATPTRTAVTAATTATTAARAAARRSAEGRSAVPDASAGRTSTTGPAPATDATPGAAGKAADPKADRARTGGGRPNSREQAPVATRGDGFPLWPEAGAPPPAATNTPAVPAVPAGTMAWPTPQMHPGRLALNIPDDDKPRKRGKLPRPPAFGLPVLIAFALLATFFAWVSADPFWVAVGHAERGTATVTRCTGTGLTGSCVGSFAADGFSSARVRLNGVPDADRHAGAHVPARMVSAKSRIAYAGPVGPLNVRWLLGLVVIVLCGFGIGWATGAARLLGQRTKLAAYALSVAAPVILLLGMLVATF